MIRLPITLGLAAVTAIGCLPTVSRLVGDHGQPALAVLQVTTPFSLPPLLVLLVIHAVTRRRILSAVTAVVVLLNVAWLVPLYVGDGHPKGPALNVMTANLRYGLADPFELVQLVRDHRVDILATEELTDREVTYLRGAGLDKLLPYSNVSTKSYGPDGSGLWSRYPITDLDSWDTRFRAVGAVVHVPGHDVTVRVVHAFPPIGDERGVWHRDAVTILAKVKALPTSGPTIVLGDFNATLDSTLLRNIEGAHYRDAPELAGSGYPRTWGLHPGSTGFLDLDHVFVDKHLGATSTAVYDLKATDHNALLARLVLR